MAHISLTQRVKELELQIGTVLATRDLDNLEPTVRDACRALKHQATDARLAVREYEYADTRATQLAAAKEGRHYLSIVQERIVKLSEYDIFSAVTVAQLSAHIESIATELS